MKKLLLLFMLIPMTVFCQEYSGNNTFSKVIKAEGKSAQEIRSSIREWVSETYNEAGSVIDLDSESKTIIKGITPINSYYEEYVVTTKYYTTITCSFKEGRFKADLTINAYYNTVTKEKEYLNNLLSAMLRNKPISKEEYFNIFREGFKKPQPGFSQKKMIKMGEKMLLKKGDTMYKDFLWSQKSYVNTISGVFNSIDSKVNSVAKPEDDW